MWNDPTYETILNCFVGEVRFYACVIIADIYEMKIELNHNNEAHVVIDMKNHRSINKIRKNKRDKRVNYCNIISIDNISNLEGIQLAEN